MHSVTKFKQGNLGVPTKDVSVKKKWMLPSEYPEEEHHFLVTEKTSPGESPRFNTEEANLPEGDTNRTFCQIFPKAK